MWIRENVPGIVIPDEIIDRLNEVPQSRQKEIGKQICIEIIQQVTEIEGVHGVHVMAYRQEELVAEIIDESGLLDIRQQKMV
jgi:methylenetetrahydrofolate reductase (NADPH)